jgi:hypothetical protein
MNIYFVIRWGHDESPDGPNGEDTNFIVRARNRDDAATIVDDYLENLLHHSKVEAICNVIVELGVAAGQESEAAILHGPWYAYGVLAGCGQCISWIREIHTDYQWKEFIELYPPGNNA